jgi:hypothetical protein
MHVVPLRGLRTTIVVAGERELRIIVDLTGATVCFRVEWAGTRVMTGHIHSNGDGTYLQRRVTISRWQRGNWQSALFDAFPSDSHRLLTVPVAPVLSEVGAELIRFLGKRSLPADGELF